MEGIVKKAFHLPHFLPQRREALRVSRLALGNPSVRRSPPFLSVACFLTEVEIGGRAPFFSPAL